jgi:VCBS repeat-containing protein
MIDEIDRRTLMGADREDEGDRRQLLFWLLWALLIFFVLFGCGQTAMWFGSGGLEDVDVRSGLTVDYGIWTPAAFGGINPLIIAEAAGDNGGGIFLASNPSDSCFLLGDCTPNPPTPTPTPSKTPTITPTPTETPTPTNTPTVTDTPPPTYTFTPVYTPTNTPTPTPLVYPIKIANPGKIPPGPTTLQFSIIVINYGSIPPAHLTAVIDRLPPGMSYNGGCNPACGASPGDTTITWNVDEWIPQSGFSRFRFIANADGAAGEIFLNEVETQGGNFETSINVKQVYVYTPTPVPTAVTMPVANDDPTGAPATTYSTNEDNPLSIGAPGLLANDTDAPWDTLYAFPLGAPSNGSVVVNLDGSFTYTPALNYFSPPGIPETFTYEACDELVGGLCDSATVYITVNSVEDAPIAQNDTYPVNEDQILNATSPGIRANDSDGDDFIAPLWDTLTVNTSPVVGVSNGTLLLNGDGSFAYTPNGDYFGGDSFSYRICDPTGRCDVAVVTINVQSVNDPPVALDDSATTNEDVPIDIDVLSNDSDPVEGDPLSVSSVTQGLNGSVTNNGSDVTYAPNANFFGNDSFTYTVTDGNGGSDTASVSVVIISVNDPPIAVDDPFPPTLQIFTNQDTPITIDVLANDSDPIEGDLVGINAIGGLLITPSNGAIAIDNGGTPGDPTDDQVIYTPNAGFHDPVNPDSFEYEIIDVPGGDTDIAMVTVFVNDAPTAVDDAYSIDEDNTLIVPGLPLPGPEVLDNDSDPNGDPLQAVLTSAASNGTVTVFNPDGSFTYQPNLNFFGVDSFTYDACDDLLVGLCDGATVTITVNAINDDPVAVDDTTRTNVDTSVVIDVLANDTDADVGDILTVSDPPLGVPTATAFGTVVNNGGNVLYTPNLGFFGLDTFTYEVTDGIAFDTATVTVTVSGAPTAFDDAYSTDEDTPLNVALPGVLNNDTDPNGDALTAVLDTDVSDGTLFLSMFGGFNYAPDSDFEGIDSFTYHAEDPGGLPSNIATVTITVNAVEDDPIAVNDSAATPEDIPISIAVLVNDSDPDGDVIQITTWDPASIQGGTIVLDDMGNGDPADDELVYTPPADYYSDPAPDTFTYTISDGTGRFDTATVSVTVNSLNDDPVAVSDYRLTNTDVPINIDILTNDYDVDGDLIDLIAITQPANGTVTINDNGTPANLTDDFVEYVPNAGYHHPVNPDTFTYDISDGNGGTDTGTVYVRVDIRPAASDDSYSVDEDTILSVPPPPDVLNNDGDLDGDSLSAFEVSPPSNGTLVLNIDGSFTYDSNPDFNGIDSFTYQACDAPMGGLCDTASVTITVNPINDDPVAVDDSEHANFNTALAIDVLSNDSDIDGDNLTITLVDNPTVKSGTASINNNGTPGDPTDDFIDYTPADGYFSNPGDPDSFTYTIDDGNGGTAIATVQVDVNGPPMAVDDAYSTDEDQILIVPGLPGGGVLFNDTDPNNDLLNAVKLSDPSDGTLTLNADGSFTYDPDFDFNGSDSFSYEACDPDGECDSANVTINVISQPDTPIAADDNYSVDEDEDLDVPPDALEVLDNDYDGDGDPLIASQLSDPTNGILNFFNADGSFSYTPTANYYGPDQFQYEACDPTPLCDTATVFITVNSVNDPPVAVDDPDLGPPIVTDEDTPIDIDVLANDSDPVEGDPLSVDSVSPGPGTNGTLTNNGSDVTYLPNANYFGSASFTYTVTDGNGGYSTATVTLSVNEVNDDPVAVNDNRSMGQFDPPLTIDVLTNDYDVDIFDTLIISSWDTPTPFGATVTQSGNSLVYTPSGSDPVNPDIFSYLIDDGRGGTDSASVSVLVNDPPTAVNDTYTTDEDQDINEPGIPGGGVLLNDSDPNSDTLFASVTSTTSNGSLSLNSDGSFTYSPNANYYGPDQFTYEACDAPSGGTCDTATVDITVNSVNDPPVAGNDSAPPEDQVTASTTGITINVVANDSDLEGAIDPATVVIVNPPAHGTAVSNGNGTVTYTLTDGHFITDSFTYTVDDDQSPVATSNIATVNITIDQPVVKVYKEADPTDAVLGDSIDFFIYVWNDGLGTAYDVSLQDTLGSCFQWVGGNPSGPLGDFAEGNAAVRVASVQVVATSSCDNTNTAIVTSTNGAGSISTVSISLGGPITMLNPPSTSMASTTSGTSTEAAIAFLIPAAMFMTPFVFTWLRKVKGTSQPRQ